MQQEKNWSEYWQQEGAGGEVFVNQHGEKHPELEAFWRDIVESSGAKAIIDIASGGGSIFSVITNPDAYSLVATDISQPALDTQKQRINQIQPLVCDSTAIPVEDKSFDLVVSQFGIEYAGINAFKEAARIVSASGKVSMLCHIEDGYIDAKNKAELQGAQLCADTGFASKAIKLVSAMAENDEPSLKTAFEQFTHVEPLLAKYAIDVSKGVHVHLYNGFKQLMTQRQNYAVQDIVNWLGGMQNEVDKSILRLTEMRSAALSNSDVGVVKQQFEDANLADIRIEPFYLSGYTLPVAWHISAIAIES